MAVEDVLEFRTNVEYNLTLADTEVSANADRLTGPPPPAVAFEIGRRGAPLSGRRVSPRACGNCAASGGRETAGQEAGVGRTRCIIGTWIEGTVGVEASLEERSARGVIPRVKVCDRAEVAGTEEPQLAGQ